MTVLTIRHSFRGDSRVYLAGRREVVGGWMSTNNVPTRMQVARLRGGRFHRGALDGKPCCNDAGAKKNMQHSKQDAVTVAMASTARPYIGRGLAI